VKPRDRREAIRIRMRVREVRVRLFAMNGAALGGELDGAA